jgi:hypothetical protein
MLTMVPPEATSNVVPLVTALLLMLVPLETICVDTDLDPLNAAASSTRSRGHSKPCSHDNSMKDAYTLNVLISKLFLNPKDTPRGAAGPAPLFLSSEG